jgi:hypothetical protein
MGETCSTHEIDEKSIQNFSRKGKDHLEDIEVDGKIEEHL